MARRVGNSLASEWEVSSSPKSLETLYVAVQKQLDDLREEIKVYLSRNKNTWDNLLIEIELLIPHPLVKVYDLYFELDKSKVKECQ